MEQEQQGPPERASIWARKNLNQVLAVIRSNVKRYQSFSIWLWFVE